MPYLVDLSRLGIGSSPAIAYKSLTFSVRNADSTGTQNYITDGTEVAGPVLADSAATYTQGISERRSGTTKFYHGDSLGSTRGITNTSQTGTDGILYDAFGLVVSRKHCHTASDFLMLAYARKSTSIHS